jgi:hypothetical protein
MDLLGEVHEGALNIAALDGAIARLGVDLDAEECPHRVTLSVVASAGTRPDGRPCCEAAGDRFLGARLGRADIGSASARKRRGFGGRGVGAGGEH